MAQLPSRAPSAPILKWQYGGCSPGPYCQRGWFASPAVADLDGDGQPDVIWGAYDVVALRGDDGALKWRAPSGSRVWPGIAVADLTGDGTVEVVVARDGDQLTVYNRFGSVVWTRNPFGGAGELRTLAVADLEDDGRLEIIVGKAGSVASRQINVLEPDGTVRPGWPARHDGEPGYSFAAWNQNVVVGDMNGDGVKELFAGGGHYINAFDRNGNQLSVNSIYAPKQFWSQVGVHVDHAVDLRGYANCGVEHRPRFDESAPVIADVDGDGVSELIVVGNIYNCGPSRSLYHMPFIFGLDRTRWSGSGFDWTVIPTPGPGSPPRSEDFNVIEQAHPDPAVADLDGDGFMEIIYPSYDGKVHAYWLDKTEHGSWPYTVPTSGASGDEFRFAAEPIVVDLDNDGHAEVIFTSWPKKATGGVGQLHILDDLGRELHRINLPPRALSSTWNGGLGAPTIANIDADADLELVIGTVGSGVVAYDLPNTANARVLWGTGRAMYGRTGAVVTAAPPPDRTPPAPPSTPDLAAASDSGVSSTDNVTNDTTPTITGTAEAGSTVRIISDGGQVGSGTATGGAYSITTSALSPGTHSITATATDAAGNVSPSSGALSVTIDTSPPTVTINQAATQAETTSTSPINFTAVFSEDVSGFSGTDVTIGGTAGGTKTATVSGGPSTYTVAVRGMTRGGSVIATIGAGVATDTAGNGNTASTSTDNTVTFVPADTTPPPAPSTPDLAAASDSGVSSTDNVTNDTTPTFTGTAEAGSTVRISSDGVQVGSGPATGGAYSITTSSLSPGTHSITATATDGATNVSPSSGALSVTIDTTAPAAAIDQAGGQPDPTNTSPIRFTVVFSESVSGFSGADVMITGTAGGDKSVEVTGGPGTYDVAVSGMTTSGTVVATIGAGVAQDAAGNANVASTSSDNEVSFDAPDVTPPAPPSTPDLAAGSDSGLSATDNLTNNTTPTFTGTAEAGSTVTIFSDGSEVGSGTATGGIYSITTGPLSAGAHRITATATDGASNVSSPSGALSVTIDTTAPAVAIDQAGSQPDPTNTSPIRFTVVFSESVSGFSGADVMITGTAGGDKTVAVTGGPSTYDVAVSGMTTSGTVLATIGAGVAQDATGNGNTASTSTDGTVTFNTGTTALTATRFEETDPSITYTIGIPDSGRPHGWWHGSRSRGWSSVTSSFNRSNGARATFTFTGTEVRWIGFRASWAGIARVSVDGGPFTEIDLFLPPCTSEQRAQGCVDEEAQAVVFSATGLAAETHTLTIESTGRKRGGDACHLPTPPAAPGPGLDCSADWAVVVDAFDVAPALPPPTTGTRSEETSIAYTGGWTRGDRSRPSWSGATAALSSAAPGAAATLTFTGTEVRWIGLRGPQTGIADVFLDGTFHATVDTFSPTEVQGVVFTATGLAPVSHELRIVATGGRNARATGASIYVDAFDVRSRFEDPDPSIIYTAIDLAARWVRENFDEAWSGTSGHTGGGTAASSAMAGAVAEFTLTGTSVSWIGAFAPWAGIAHVSLDGGPLTAVDLYRAEEELQVPVFTRTGLPAGRHTLRIEVPGERNPAASGAVIVVDAFDVTLPSPAPPVRRFQEADLTYTDGWTQGSKDPLWSGETAAFSTMDAQGRVTAGARATFTFEGTSVRWIGDRRRNGGIARVILDGAVTEVDTFAETQDEFQAVLFSREGLSPGSHTLTIEVTGRKRGGDACIPGGPACSAGSLIVVDAFEVYTRTDSTATADVSLAR